METKKKESLFGDAFNNLINKDGLNLTVLHEFSEMKLYTTIVGAGFSVTLIVFLVRAIVKRIENKTA